MSIIEKATTPAAIRRYESAAALRDDLTRLIQGDPVHARRLRRFERLQRAAARHPLLTSICLALIILVVSLTLTLTSIWFINNRPHKIERINGGQLTTWSSGSLRSFGGRALATWTGIYALELADRPPRLGGGRVIVVANSDQQEPGFLDRSRLRVYSAGELTRPLWTPGDLEIPDEIFPQFRESGADVTAFQTRTVLVADVFPDLSGDEIVAIHWHAVYFPTLIRVYDLSGKTLFSAWRRGYLWDASWCEEKRVLVVIGVSNHGWEARGLQASPLARPSLVSAFKVPYAPENVFLLADSAPDEHLSDHWLRPDWTRCLWPIGFESRLPIMQITRAPGVTSSDSSNIMAIFAVSDDYAAAAQLFVISPGSGSVIQSWRNDGFVKDPELSPLPDLRLLPLIGTPDTTALDETR